VERKTISLGINEVWYGKQRFEKCIFAGGSCNEKLTIFFD
jgi:hypothetical protein